jgi:DNA/RNA endonuclease YhcR with UshA esterase domain
LIYIAAIKIRPTVLNLDEITPEFVGRSVTATGRIIYKTSHPAGHIFLTVSYDGATVQVPLFADMMKQLSPEDFVKGRTITVTGLVGEYKGQLQIVPRKPEDVVLND